MINEFNNENNILRRYFQPGEVFLLDTGFRDFVPLLQQCNYRYCSLPTIPATGGNTIINSGS